MTGERLLNVTFLRIFCQAKKVEDVWILQGISGKIGLWRGVKFP